MGVLWEGPADQSQQAVLGWRESEESLKPGRCVCVCLRGTGTSEGWKDEITGKSRKPGEGIVSRKEKCKNLTLSDA